MAFVAVGCYLAYQWWNYENDKIEIKKLKEQKKRVQELKKKKEEELMKKLNEDVKNLTMDERRRLGENFQEFLICQKEEREIQHEILNTGNNFNSWISNQVLTISINMAIMRFNGTINLAQRAFILIKNSCAYRAIRQGITYLSMAPQRRRLTSR